MFRTTGTSVHIRIMAISFSSCDFYSYYIVIWSQIAGHLFICSAA